MEISDLQINSFSRFHLIGCGGAGMVGIGIILLELGKSVSGSDLVESANTRLLRAQGAKIYIGHKAANLARAADNLLLIRSSAINEDNPEFADAVKAGITHCRRGEFLAAMAAEYRRPVAVAGSHGKTSVTAQLAHILKCAGLDPGYCIGGKVNSWTKPAATGNGDLFICESDESDGTLVHMQAHLGIIINIEDDHAWSVGGTEKIFANFAEFGHNASQILHPEQEPMNAVFANHRLRRLITENDFKSCGDFKNLSWGPFQRQNAVIAIRAAEILGVAPETAMRCAVEFPGVARRMSVHLESQNLVVLEDYAHHPTEVAAAITACRERWPEHRLRVVFQPHRYARLAKYLDGFARELRKADAVIITPVFTAWTESGPLLDKDLARKIGNSANFADARSWTELAKRLIKDIHHPEVLAVFGAGDIGQLPAEILQITT